MLALTVKTENTSRRVVDGVEKAAFRNVGHAAGSIRKTAVASILKAEGPSPEGTPPHTRARQLNRAIRFDHDRAAQSAVIGPRASVVGESGSAHELGGEYLGQEFEPRPFMVPALDEALPRFSSEWAGSIGE